jgi:hypothetical protein
MMVGGAPMYPSKDIIDNAVNSKDHTTLVAAVKAAGLVDTLKGSGPFTVFAPTNDAFAQLPAGTVDTLLKPENKPVLTKVLTYHVVPGRVDARAGAADPGRRRQGHAQDRQRRHADGHHERAQRDDHRRQGRLRHRDHRRRLPVERRHPRGQQGAAICRRPCPAR